MVHLETEVTLLRAGGSNDEPTTGGMAGIESSENEREGRIRVGRDHLAVPPIETQEHHIGAREKEKSIMNDQKGDRPCLKAENLFMEQYDGNIKQAVEVIFFSGQ